MSDPMVEPAASVRTRAAQLRQRPLVHFTAPVNWLNDPNGLIRWEGTTHLFYQHNPHASVWARPSWGHASSRDLLRWTDLPAALTPTDDFDSMGCYSGSCVDDRGTPTIVYTAVSSGPRGLVEEVHLASGDADLVRWSKRAEAVLRAPEGLDLVAFRDPHVRRGDDGRWRLVIGAGFAGGGGAVLGYTSDDLIGWEPLGVLLDEAALRSAVPGVPGSLGQVWECPVLVRVGDTDVLVLSVWDGEPSHVLGVAGRLAGDRFEPWAVQRLDAGASFYAPHPLVHADGRVDLVGWLREDALAAPADGGWAGMMSLPRELGLAAGRPVLAPGRSLSGLRAERVAVAEAGSRDVAFAGLHGAVQVRAERAGGDRAGHPLTVRLTDAAGAEAVVVRDDGARVSMHVAGHAGGPAEVLDLVAAPPSGEPVVVTVIADVGVVELFVTGAAAATVRLADDVRITGGTATAGASRVEVWRLTLPPPSS